MLAKIWVEMIIRLQLVDGGEEAVSGNIRKLGEYSCRTHERDLVEERMAFT